MECCVHAYKCSGELCVWCAGVSRGPCACTESQMGPSFPQPHTTNCQALPPVPKSHREKRSVPLTDTQAWTTFFQDSCLHSWVLGYTSYIFQIIFYLIHALSPSWDSVPWGLMKDLGEGTFQLTYELLACLLWIYLFSFAAFVSQWFSSIKDLLGHVKHSWKFEGQRSRSPHEQILATAPFKYTR